MRDTESVVAIPINEEKEIEYKRKFIKDEIKKCDVCVRIHNKLGQTFNVLPDGVNTKVFSYICCNKCLDRYKILEKDIYVSIYCLVEFKEYPPERKIIMEVLRGHTTNLCIPSIYSNPSEDDVEEYYYEFHAKYLESYNNKIHDAFKICLIIIL